MQLAYRLEMYRASQLRVPVEAVQRAEELDLVWKAEAYRTEALSPLACLAAVTSRIKLGIERVERHGLSRRLEMCRMTLPNSTPTSNRMSAPPTTGTSKRRTRSPGTGTLRSVSRGTVSLSFTDTP
jgi:hypothetical protein